MKHTITAILVFTFATSFGKVSNGYNETVNKQYFDKTEAAIAEFKRACPDLFAKVDSLEVLVMIKVMPDYEMGSRSGTTSLKTLAGKNISEYGDNTVSVKIIDSKRTVRVLAHELGHAYYQILFPAYNEFYYERYLNHEYHGSTLGHDSDDLSGKMAYSFEKQFIKAAKSQ